MEYEKRVMLNEEQYFNIVSFYLHQDARYPFISQTNYYFDTKDLFLKQNHMVLRVRIIKNKGSEFTLKIKEEKGDREVTQKLSYLATKSLLKKNHFPKGEIIKELAEKGIAISSLCLIANLTTLRLEIKENDYLVVIDKNEYLDVLDYNLEIESSSREKAKEVILDFCNKFNLEYKKDYVSKSSRVFNRIYNKN